MTTHTAGKLHVRTAPSGHSVLYSAAGWDVATTERRTTRGAEKANAEHLAHCWNTNPGLVAALDEAAAHLESLGEGPPGRTLHTADLNAIAARVRDARAALAAAQPVPA